MPILETRAHPSLIGKILRAISGAVLTCLRIPHNQAFSLRKMPASGPDPIIGPSGASAVRRRLAEEKACLERLEAERTLRGDAAFRKATENRIVWSELLELELQDIDEQVKRLRTATGGGSPPAERRCS